MFTHQKVRRKPTSTWRHLRQSYCSYPQSYTPDPSLQHQITTIITQSIKLTEIIDIWEPTTSWSTPILSNLHHHHHHPETPAFINHPNLTPSHTAQHYHPSQHYHWTPGLSPLPQPTKPEHRKPWPVMLQLVINFSSTNLSEAQSPTNDHSSRWPPSANDHAGLVLSIHSSIVLVISELLQETYRYILWVIFNHFCKMTNQSLKASLLLGSCPIVCYVWEFLLVTRSPSSFDTYAQCESWPIKLLLILSVKLI